MSTAQAPKFSPDSIRAKRFNTIFRGCDPHQVRTYLDEVAASYAAVLAEVDSMRQEIEQLTACAPGPESPSGSDMPAGEGDPADRAATIEMQIASDELLEAARKEASAIVARANDEAARMILRARAESRGRPGAETLAVLEAAANETGDPEIAREQARVMIGEAKAVRERILTDLAKRRRVAHVQLEQMRVAREKLADSLREARRLVDEASRDLSMAEVEARIAAEAAARRVNAEPLPSSQELEVELLPGSRLVGGSLRRSVPDAGSADVGVVGDVGVGDVDAVVEVGGVEVGGVEMGGVEVGGVEVDDLAASALQQDTVGAAATGDAVGEAAPHIEPVAAADAGIGEPEDAVLAGGAASIPESGVTAAPHHRPTAGELESLFARVRAAASPPASGDHGTADTAAHHTTSQSGSPSSAGSPLNEAATPAAALPPGIAVAELDGPTALLSAEASERPVLVQLPQSVEPEAADDEAADDEAADDQAIGVVVDLTRHVANRDAQEPAELGSARQRHLHVVGEAGASEAVTDLLTDELADDLSAELPDELPEIPTDPGADVVSLRGPGSEVQLAFVIGPLQGVLTRSVKRELQDVQSAALSAVRTARSRPQIDVVLGAEEDQRARLGAAIRPVLADAARAGADRAGRALGDPEDLVADLADDLCSEIAGAIRDEIRSDIDAATSGGLDARSLAEMISTSFRHWTSERVGATTADYLRVAFEIGSSS